MLHLFRCVLLRLREHLHSEEEKVENDVPSITSRPGLTRMLSEDGAVPQAAVEKDLHTWMNEEDRRREELFKKPDASAIVGSHRARKRSVTPGAHVGFQLAQRGTRLVYGCGACGAWLVRAQDVLSDTEHAARVSLDDSRHTICTASADVYEAEGCEVDSYLACFC